MSTDRCETDLANEQRTCQCVTLAAHCWISGCLTSELQTSETIAHRVVTSRLTAAGSGGGAGSMLAAGTHVNTDGAEGVLIHACCRCSDGTCMLHHLSGLLLPAADSLVAARAASSTSSLTMQRARSCHMDTNA